MTIGFYLIDRQTLDSLCGYKCAAALVKSAKKVMPKVSVVHFTDDTSPAVEGSDAVRMGNQPMAKLRMRHHCNVTGDW